MFFYFHIFLQKKVIPQYITFNTFENSFFVFVKCKNEYKENKELLKYCFLMQAYRQTMKKKEEKKKKEEGNLQEDIDGQYICDKRQLSEYRHTTDCLFFSIENNVKIVENCRIVDNQFYEEIDLSQFMEKDNNLSVFPKKIKHYTDYMNLLTKIDSEIFFRLYQSHIA